MSRVVHPTPPTGRGKDRDAADDETPAAPPNRRMTEREFVAWASRYSKLRAEWVDGKVLILTPDNADHDDLQGWLRSVLGSYVEEKDLGIVRGPNFWVRLPRTR